jgi:hypothetical protein
VVALMRERYGDLVELEHAPVGPTPPPGGWPTDPQTLVATRVDGSAEDLVICSGGQPFPASVLDGPPDALDRQGPVYDGLRGTLEFFGSEFDGYDKLRWWLAWQSADAAQFLAEAPDGGYADVAVRLDAGEWVPAGMGGCDLRSAVVPNAGPAEWALDPAYPPPTAASTELHVLVMEQACAGGEPAFGRVAPPVVEYTADSLIMTVGVTPLGSATCPGHPPTPATVILPEPLGDRELLDGGSHPPEPPTRDDW